MSIDGSKIAIDIKITFKETDDTLFESCYKIYSSYFENKDFLNEYNEPKCKSKLCSPRIEPLVLLIVCGVKRIMFRVANVKYV